MAGPSAPRWAGFCPDPCVGLLSRGSIAIFDFVQQGGPHLTSWPLRVWRPVIFRLARVSRRKTMDLHSVGTDQNE